MLEGKVPCCQWGGAMLFQWCAVTRLLWYLKRAGKSIKEHCAVIRGIPDGLDRIPIPLIQQRTLPAHFTPVIGLTDSQLTQPSQQLGP